ncbi:MAG: hypothetical protein IKE42_28345 [Aquamicrobium sp.]|nr:hypothetical protein [Aquamicrobium sp.]
METKKVLMLRNKLGSPDGVKVNHYDAGQVYDVPVALADSFITDRVAELVEPEGEKALEVAENKAVSKAPKNKAVA